MRTSPSQFLLLVEFMERNGDLSKPTEGPQGRATNTRLWTQLVNMLNADSTGDTKLLERWRKVWSDLKNNTKKKAARINKAARKTGGGEACRLKLSDLEQRVLSIMGTRAATGLEEVPEIGIEEEGVEMHNDSPTIFGINQQIEQQTCSTVEEWNIPGSSSQPTCFAPVTETNNNIARHVEDTENNGLTQSSDPAHLGTPLLSSGARHAQITRHVTDTEGVLTQCNSDPALLGTPLPSSGARQHAQMSITSVPPPPLDTFARTPLPPVGARQPAPPSPLPLPPTPRRRRPGRLVQDTTSPRNRRTRTQTQSDLARQAFVRSDCEWRTFQQETERERIRLRNEELRQQERWLDLFGQFLALGDRIVNFLEKK